MSCCLPLQLEAGSKLPPAALNPRTLMHQRFALKVPAALELAIKRQWTLFLRNKAFLIVRTGQVSNRMLFSAECPCCLAPDHAVQTSVADAKPSVQTSCVWRHRRHSLWQQEWQLILLHHNVALFMGGA